jgi:hypothetical protein
MEYLMLTHRTRNILVHLTLAAGAVAVLVTGADHLYEYTANRFSTVPTIGTLFLLNFISSTMVGAGLLLPMHRIANRFAPAIEALLALSGIAIAATSLMGLWISESSSLLGFTDYGFRTTIIVAIIAESMAILALTAYLALAHPRASFQLRAVPPGRPSRRRAR